MVRHAVPDVSSLCVTCLVAKLSSVESSAPAMMRLDARTPRG